MGRRQFWEDRVERPDEDAADCERAISALAELSSERPSLDDHTVRVPLRERKGAITAAVRRLDDADIAIADIALRRPTLDDVFISLTGHAAEEEPAEESTTAEHRVAA